MEYEKQATEIFNQFRKSWMDDEDWNEFTKEMEKQGFTIQSLSNKLKEGVKLGHSIELQLALVKKELNKKFI